MVVTAVGAPAADGTAIVQLTFLNDQSAAILVTPPDRVPASVVVAGTTTTTTLIRDGTAGSITVGAAGFVRVRYTAHLPRAPGATAVVTLALDNGREAVGVAADSPRATDTVGSDATVVVATLPAPTVDTGNAFLGNLSAYEPVYAVFGPGTNTGGFIQISFKYQLLAEASRRWLSRAGSTASNSATRSGRSGISARRPSRSATSIINPNYSTCSLRGRWAATCWSPGRPAYATNRMAATAPRRAV
jgi:phospholipase A1